MDLALSASSFSSPMTKLTMRSTHTARQASKLSSSAFSPMRVHLEMHSSLCRQSLMISMFISDPSSQFSTRMRCGELLAPRESEQRAKKTSSRERVSLKWEAMALCSLKLYYNMLNCALSISEATSNYPQKLFLFQSWLSLRSLTGYQQSSSTRDCSSQDQQLYYLHSPIMSTAPPRTKRITKNHFVLLGNQRLYFKAQTEVDFKPTRKKTKQSSRSIIPTFVNDRKFYTYAFQLPSEMTNNDQEMKEDHEKRIKEACMEITELYIPKPRSKNKYCGVCRGHYEDYKDHVQSESHLNSLKKSAYQLQIVKFCAHLQERLFYRKEVEEVKTTQLSTVEENSEKSLQQFELPSASKSLLR